jgi:2-dehydro-3-deoxy-D-arabinonate dehydratase
VTVALYRVRLPDGEVRLARGDPDAGPEELLQPELSLDGLLGEAAEAFPDSVRAAAGVGPVPTGSAVLAPVESQEVWGSGVTYVRSRDARMEEAEDPSIYDRLYAAERPEVFFKSPGWRAAGPGEPIGVRRDSTWDVPEPELGLVLAADLGIAGYVVGNDVSSRSIEGENPLYLPQAKTYEGSCALGPCIVPAGEAAPPFDIRLEIVRQGALVFEGETSTARMKRSFEELAACLGRALRFPVGAVLLTGTGIVPDLPFTLLAGDTVRIAMTGLGTLENPVVAVGQPTDAMPRPPGRA